VLENQKQFNIHVFDISHFSRCFHALFLEYCQFSQSLFQYRSRVDFATSVQTGHFHSVFVNANFSLAFNKYNYKKILKYVLLPCVFFVAICTDRYLSVRFRLWKNVFFKKPRPLIVALAIITVILLLNLNILFTFGYEMNIGNGSTVSFCFPLENVSETKWMFYWGVVYIIFLKCSIYKFLLYFCWLKSVVTQIDEFALKILVNFKKRSYSGGYWWLYIYRNFFLVFTNCSDSPRLFIPKNFIIITNLDANLINSNLRESGIHEFASRFVLMIKCFVLE
jgi:hypothetical protein